MLLASLTTEIEPYVALTIIGFAIGVFGHLAKSRLTIAIGILIVMVSSITFLGVSGYNNQDPPAAGEAPPQ